MALQTKIISKKDLGEVITDTTVQEKAVTFPTDSKLLLKSIKNITQLGKQIGISYRQSYARVAQKLSTTAMRVAHGRKFNLMRSCNNKLKNRLGRIVRETERKLAELSNETTEANKGLIIKLNEQLALGQHLLEQTQHSEDKVYSLHEPDVSCIAKGKVHKKYEFCSKVGIISTIKNSFIIAVKSFTGNPFDGKTFSTIGANCREQNQYTN